MWSVPSFTRSTSDLSSTLQKLGRGRIPRWQSNAHGCFPLFSAPPGLSIPSLRMQPSRYPYHARRPNPTFKLYLSISVVYVALFTRIELPLRISDINSKFIIIVHLSIIAYFISFCKVTMRIEITREYFGIKSLYDSRFL